MLLTIVGRQVLNLNKICRCSDSLSKMWSRGPLFSEQSRQRSVNAVKLRSSGSVIAKHLMRRSRRHELSMYTAVALGWRETVRPAYRGCRQGGDEASRRGCVRGALRSARHPPPRPGPGPPPPRRPARLPRPHAAGVAGKTTLFLFSVCDCRSLENCDDRSFRLI